MKIYLNKEYVGSDLLWDYYLTTQGDNVVDCENAIKVTKKGRLSDSEYQIEAEDVSAEIYALILQIIVDCLALEDSFRQWRP